jgi:hypothetical protein
MALQFAKYERAESTLESLGTVLENVGKDGFLELIPRNVKDVTKRVVVILKKKNGTSTMVTCSQQVSDGIRNKTIELGHVLNFEILEGEAGVPFISMPGGLISVAVKSITVKDYAVDTTSISLEDLIG